MATLNISLPNPMREWIKNQIDQGQYASSSDYLRDLIRKDQERIRKITEFQAAITEGLMSADVEIFNLEEFKQRMVQMQKLIT